MAVLIARYVHEPEGKPAPAAAAAAETVSYLAMLRYRNMILCVLMSIFMVAWMVLGWAFLPLFYVKVRQLSAGQMSVLMSLLGLSAAFFSFIVPRLSDRLGRRPVVVASNLLGVLVPLAALYFDGPLYLLGALIFLGWSASGTFPLFMGTIPSETIPARYVATSMGLTVGIGEILGGVSGPAAAGWAADRYGLTAPILIQAGCAVAGALLALALKETAPSRVAAPAEQSRLAI
jgi:predicted MFS family arabinose efflux permease